MADPILTHIGMDRFLAQVDALAAAIAKSGWRPDYIVGVGRGGLAPATWLSHALGRPMLSVDLSAGMAAFSDDLLAILAARATARETYVFVDDINDSGGTINRLRAAMGHPAADAVRFAVLIDNSMSGARVDYSAETIDRSVIRDWFVFPWEAVAGQAAHLADRAQVPDRTL